MTAERIEEIKQRSTVALQRAYEDFYQSSVETLDLLKEKSRQLEEAQQTIAKLERQLKEFTR